MNAQTLSKPLLCLYAVRSCLFYMGYILSAILFAPLCFLTVVFPFAQRVWLINRWSWFVLWWLKVTCNIRVEITAEVSLPDLAPLIVMSNHQSTWEALFLQLLFCPSCTVLKKELLRIPFFGWGLRLLRPISIDRTKPRLAARHFISQGQAALDEKRSIVLFPEGTRVGQGQSVPLSLGGFRLAVATNTPVLPVWHDAGLYWPARQFLKFPGIIQCRIGSPIYPSDKPQRLLDAFESKLQAMGNKS